MSTYDEEWAALELIAELLNKFDSVEEFEEWVKNKDQIP